MSRQQAWLAAIFSACAPVLAQNSVDERPFGWHASAGLSVTTGTANRYLHDGWIVSGGVDWRPRPDLPFAISLDAHYSDYDATNELISLGSAATQTQIDDGSGSTLGADVNVKYAMPFGARLRTYLIAGAGVDRRRIEFTQTVLFDGFLCDPWWGICGIGTIAGDELVARSSSTRFAWNAGIGLEFPTRDGAWFLDARYRRIETRTPTEYVPIQIGYRF